MFIVPEKYLYFSRTFYWLVVKCLFSLREAVHLDVQFLNWSYFSFGTMVSSVGVVLWCFSSGPYINQDVTYLLALLGLDSIVVYLSLGGVVFFFCCRSGQSIVFICCLLQAVYSFSFAVVPDNRQFLFVVVPGRRFELQSMTSHCCIHSVTSPRGTSDKSFVSNTRFDLSFLLLIAIKQLCYIRRGGYYYHAVPGPCQGHIESIDVWTLIRSYGECLAQINLCRL